MHDRRDTKTGRDNLPLALRHSPRTRHRINRRRAERPGQLAHPVADQLGPGDDRLRSIMLVRRHLPAGRIHPDPDPGQLRDLLPHRHPRHEVPDPVRRRGRHIAPHLGHGSVVYSHVAVPNRGANSRSKMEPDARKAGTRPCFSRFALPRPPCAVRTDSRRLLHPHCPRGIRVSSTHLVGPPDPADLTYLPDPAGPLDPAYLSTYLTRPTYLT